MRRLLVVLAVLVACMAPRAAYAQDGFVGGVQDFLGTREVETQDYESEFQESYVPDTRASEGDTREVVEYESATEAVNGTLDAFNSIPWHSGNVSALSFLRAFFGAAGAGSATMRAVVITAPIALVFMWWGVRKALRVLMSSFRRGKANV